MWFHTNMTNYLWQFTWAMFTLQRKWQKFTVLVGHTLVHTYVLVPSLQLLLPLCNSPSLCTYVYMYIYVRIFLLFSSSVLFLTFSLPHLTPSPSSLPPSPMQKSHFKINVSVTPRCVFYNYTERSWSTYAVKTRHSRAKQVVTCLTHHLTSFAVTQEQQDYTVSYCTIFCMTLLPWWPFGGLSCCHGNHMACLFLWCRYVFAMLWSKMIA